MYPKTNNSTLIVQKWQQSLLLLESICKAFILKMKSLLFVNHQTTISSPKSTISKEIKIVKQELDDHIVNLKQRLFISGSMGILSIILIIVL